MNINEFNIWTKIRGKLMFVKFDQFSDKPRSEMAKELSVLVLEALVMIFPMSLDSG